MVRLTENMRKNNQSFIVLMHIIISALFLIICMTGLLQANNNKKANGNKGKLKKNYRYIEKVRAVRMKWMDRE